MALHEPLEVSGQPTERREIELGDGVEGLSGHGADGRYAPSDRAP